MEDRLAGQISDAEYVVMEVLWNEAPLSAQDVREKAPREWSATTVKTLLSRLVGKDIVASQEDGRRFLYRPKMKREDYVESESRRLIDRLFEGKLRPLVAHFADQGSLTDDDIADIEAILKRLKP
jgi:BlaI family penicillinase repressor